MVPKAALTRSLLLSPVYRNCSQTINTNTSLLFEKCFLSTNQDNQIRTIFPMTQFFFYHTDIIFNKITNDDANAIWVDFKYSLMCVLFFLPNNCILLIYLNFKHLFSGKLEKFEIPQAVKLVAEVWSPDMGLVTAAFKIKRKDIQQRYQCDLRRMYAS